MARIDEGTAAGHGRRPTCPHVVMPGPRIKFGGDPGIHGLCMASRVRPAPSASFQPDRRARGCRMDGRIKSGHDGVVAVEEQGEPGAARVENPDRTAVEHPPDPIRGVSKDALPHRRVADRAPHRLRGRGQVGVADPEGFERIGDGEGSRRRDGGEEAAAYSAARRPSTWDWRSARRCISRRKSSIAAWNARRSLPASAI